MQAKLLPAHDMEDSRAFTRSERILLDHQKLKRMSAVDLRDLIRDVLHNPEFNAGEVDHDMHERLMRAVEEGEMDIALACPCRQYLCSLDVDAADAEAEGLQVEGGDAVDPRIAGMPRRDDLSGAGHDDIPCELGIRYPTLQAIMSGRRNIQTTLVCHDIYIDI